MIQLGEHLGFDLQRLVDTRLLVQANSGGGKSWALRRLLEQTHGQVQHLVIDPEGEFATLRERYDYVLGARHDGDTAADPRSAKLLAERLLELGASALLDIYELKAHERIRFVRLFLEALIDAPKKLWHPALVVVDEAHVYCPQKGEAESAAAVIDLATRGRKRGFCAVLATQRLSKLHKDAAAELNNKLIGRTGLDVDMARAGDELGFTSREQHHQLRELAAGDFFAFGPAFATAVVVRGHVGAVATTHPKAGARLSAPVPPPTSKIKALLPKLADLPAEAEERAKTEAELRRDLAEARRQLTLAQRAQPVPAPAPKPERVEVPVLGAKATTALVAFVERLDAAADKLLSAATGLEDQAKPIREALAKLRNGGPPPFSISRNATAPAPRVVSAQPGSPPPVRPARQQASAPVPRAQRRILNALAWLEGVGLQRADRTQLALLADQSPTSSSYANNLGALRTAGLLAYPGGGSVALTAEGRAIAEPVDVPGTTEELQRQLFARLPRALVRILEVLIAAFPASMTKADLADAAGQSLTSSSYANNLGRLRSLGLIDYPGPGQVAALPALFLERA